jgi:hypothetical protein
MEFKSTFRRKVQTGIYGLIGTEYEKYSDYSLWDTSYSPETDTLVTPFLLNPGDTLKGVSIDTAFTNTFFQQVFTVIFGEESGLTFPELIISLVTGKTNSDLKDYSKPG